MNGTVDELLRLCVAGASRAVLRLALPFLPVKQNRVLFQCYREKQYSCNPKYVCEELLRQCPEGLEVAWSFREPEKFRFLEEKGIRVLKAGSPEAIRYALTARAVCVNTYYKPTLPRRKGQLQMRTWHGGGAYKRVAMMEKLSLLKRLSLRTQLNGANLYLSSSEVFTRTTVRESFGYKGQVLECGMPRNDILINGTDGETLARIRADIGLKEDEHLVLYAPTYRDDLKTDGFGLDGDALCAALSARFGGKWKCAFRGHVFVSGGQDSFFDLTAHPDMQELLLAADVLVTDYSSSMWDMSLTGKPVFLYCTDLKDYTASRDFYTDIHTWPYPLAESNKELCERVAGFDEAAYREAVRRHHKELGSFESGHASFDAARAILDVLTPAK